VSKYNPRQTNMNALAAALQQLGGGLIAGGGPSTDPGYSQRMFGQGIANAGTAFQNTQDNALKGRMTTMQLQEMERAAAASAARDKQWANLFPASSGSAPAQTAGLIAPQAGVDYGRAMGSPAATEQLRAMAPGPTSQAAMRQDAMRQDAAQQTPQGPQGLEGLLANLKPELQALLPMLGPEEGMKLLVSQASQKPESRGAPVKVIGLDGKPVYVYPEQAVSGGMQPYEKPKDPGYKERDLAVSGGQFQKQVSYDGGRTWQPVGKPYDVRDPYLIVDIPGEDGTTTRTVIPRDSLSSTPAGQYPEGGIPIATRRTPEQVKKDAMAKSLQGMYTNLSNYRASLEDYGTSPMGALGFPPTGATDIEAKAEALRLDLKNLYDLGALVGGDFAILDRLLTSPASVSGVKIGKDGLMKQLDNLDRQLRLKLQANGFDPDELLGTNSNMTGFVIGQTATNPKTGKVIKWDGTKWNPTN
jgi:hypothetical protein